MIVEDENEYYACGDCLCCSAQGCNSGEDSDCPTDSLGESACPCTSPY